MLDELWVGFGERPEHDEPVDGDLVIRQSTIKSMDLCPARVGLTTAVDYDGTPSEAMSFGSFVHAIIERWLSEPELVEVQLERTDTLQDVWEGVAARDGFALADVATTQMIRAGIDEAREAFIQWHDHWWLAYGEHLDVLAIERTFWRPLGVLPHSERAVWMHGTPDLVTAGPHLYDWKTASRGWHEERALYELQPTFYPWLAEATTGQPSADFTFVVWDRQARRWGSHTTPAKNDLAVDGALRHAWMRAKQIDAQAFPFTPFVTVYGKTMRGWWCSATYCGAWNACPGKYMTGNDVSDVVRVQEGW